jgi:hypothetical protein
MSRTLRAPHWLELAHKAYLKLSMLMNTLHNAASVGMPGAYQAAVQADVLLARNLLPIPVQSLTCCCCAGCRCVLFVNSSLAEDPWQVAAEDAWHTLAEDADKAAIMAKVRDPANAAAQPADTAAEEGLVL